MISRDPITVYRSPTEPSTGPGLPSADRRSLLQICWRRRWTIVVAVLLVMASAAAYLVIAPRIYTGRSRLIVQQTGQHPPTTGVEPTQISSETFQLRQAEIIRAEPVLKEVADSIDAIAPKAFSSSIDPLADLQKNIAVDAGAKDGIITVSFDSLYADESAAVVNAVVAAYRTYSTDDHQPSVVDALKVLRSEKVNQEAALDAKLRELVAFKQKNGETFLTNERGTILAVQNLATISAELTRSKLAATSAYATFLQASNKALAYRQWQEAKVQAGEYERYFESEKGKALKVNEAEAEFQKLQQEYDRTAKQCDLLDTRIKALSTAEDTVAMNIHVLENAKAEARPTSPNNAAILLGAMALGLALGGLAALAHEALDQRVHAPDEAGRLLGLPVLGVIPNVRHAVASARKQLGRAVSLAPNSDIAEAHRTLRAAVYYGWPDRSVKSVLITSPERGDGKSTTASNLAISMAHAGLRVLLIDADLRAAVQHKVFDVSNTTGLTDVVGRGIAVEHALKRTDTDGLILLPSGTPTTQPAEITNSPGFGKLLQHLETQFDLVVIDSPPLLTVAEARILGAQAGLTILTLRADKSTRHDIHNACQQLLSVGSCILGVVLNGVTQRRRADDAYADALADRALIEPNLMPAAGRPLPPKSEAAKHALNY